MLKSIDNDSHIKTRLCQYEAVKSDKGVYIAKQIVLSKMGYLNDLISHIPLANGLYSLRIKVLCFLCGYVVFWIFFFSS